MTYLELLAPARNAEIGIATIDCGADAVYMAGPSFGARQDAGNSVEDVAKVCAYAARFGVRVFVTLNTILYENELDDAGSLMLSLQEAGVSAFIVQDLALVELARRRGITIPLHASTQCAIRTPETAKMYESLGFSRLVLERQLSLDRIKEIRSATDAEIEFFVHGALCVCYSGQCYLSENIAQRSANRGACIQACRSRYDLVDEDGRVLVKDKSLLSLKDYSLIDRMEALAEAGVCSFKIEGRLKNLSYVKNVTRRYSMELDELVRKHPDRYCRSSYGHDSGGFSPDLSKTFNRGYTELFLDGKRGHWAAMDIAKGHGEEVGVVESVKACGFRGIEVVLKTHPGVKLSNGDGFTFNNGTEGFRSDVCRGNTIICKNIPGLHPGLRLYRNLSTAFEKVINSGVCVRTIPVWVKASFTKVEDTFSMEVQARSQDGRTVYVALDCGSVIADNSERMLSMLDTQLSKRAGDYEFTLAEIKSDILPLMSASQLNAVRRLLAQKLDTIACRQMPMRETALDGNPYSFASGQSLDYKSNVSNSISRQIYQNAGAARVEDAYELLKPRGAELMRTKYCIRHELGMCLMHKKSDKRRLYLTNNGRRFLLGFDCKNCEMTVKEDS